MASSAYSKLTLRLSNEDDLMRAHAAVGGLQPGRRYGLEGINRAAVLMLSAHLEGFVEDLFVEALRAARPEFMPDLMIRRFHNPWPDEIDALFSVIGMQHASRGISWRRAGEAAVRMLTLKPDLAWWVGGKCCAVLDAKYKPIFDGVMRNGDAYQMLAYTTAYRLPRGYLVYARDSGVEPRAHTIRNWQRDHRRHPRRWYGSRSAARPG